MCISNTFPGETEAAGLGTVLREPLPCSHRTLELGFLLNRVLLASPSKVMVHRPLKQSWSSRRTGERFPHAALCSTTQPCSFNRLH